MVVPNTPQLSSSSAVHGTGASATASIQTLVLTERTPRVSGSSLTPCPARPLARTTSELYLCLHTDQTTHPAGESVTLRHPPSRSTMTRDRRNGQSQHDRSIVASVPLRTEEATTCIILSWSSWRRGQPRLSQPHRLSVCDQRDPAHRSRLLLESWSFSQKFHLTSRNTPGCGDTAR
jgi:hypothetical protein